MKIPAMAATLSGLLLIALPSFGQITTIEGVVTGLDGKPLQGAVISISRTDVRTKKPATVKTDKKGHFIDNLIMGTYDVTCLVDDKEADHQNNVKTSPTASKMVNFDLRQAAAQAACPSAPPKPASDICWVGRVRWKPWFA